MRRIGKFEILELIGEGGMGRVYKARDREADCLVALKVLRPEAHRDRELRGRFLREAKAAAGLDHANVARVLESGSAERPGRGEPTLYIAMELVSGQDLLRKMTFYELDLRTVVDFGRQLAEGLAAAHRGGVIHRDLKPGNVRITPDGRVKILDFGMAKLKPDPDAGPCEAVFISRYVTVVGTSHYMAPEQVRGEAIDERADLFALGVLLYQLITGQLPFRGHTASDYLREIEAREPPPPSGLVTGVVPELDGIVQRLLAKTPEDRYPNAAAVAADLSELLAGGAELDLVPQPRDAASPRRRASGRSGWSRLREWLGGGA